MVGAAGVRRRRQHPLGWESDSSQPVEMLGAAPVPRASTHPSRQAVSPPCTHACSAASILCRTGVLAPLFPPACVPALIDSGVVRARLARLRPLPDPVRACSVACVFCCSCVRAALLPRAAADPGSQIQAQSKDNRGHLVTPSRSPSPACLCAAPDARYHHDCACHCLPIFQNHAQHTRRP